MTAPRPDTSVRLLHEYFEATADEHPTATALVVGTSQVDYAELDSRANRLAHLLVERGVTLGDTVGILLERSADTYVAVLATLKAGAAYVPLDCAFPADRLAFIASDSDIRTLLTTSAWRQPLARIECPTVELDEVFLEIAAQRDERPQADIDPASPAYVIYTSGSTGQPKGVAISHASIVNFLAVATPVYGVSLSA